MQEKSRTEYSAINAAVSLAAQMIAILTGFVNRVIFVRNLSGGYVGINGLFLNILNILSLSELGIGTAITYALYRPVAEGDIPRQKVLMGIYRRFYQIVAAAVMLLGLAVLPFMDMLMKERPDVEHITLIYLLYLFNAAASYLLSYKRAMIEVSQKLYIVSLYTTLFLVLQNILQMVILETTGNFLAFLIVGICSTLAGNFCISRKADSMFPFLKEHTRERLSAEDKQSLGRNIRATILHRIGGVVVNHTDNLILSAFVGVISVGIYSNYYLLIGSVRQLMDRVFQGISASVGNLGATESPQRVERIYKVAFFIGQWLYGICTICLYELLNPFVELFFGEEYLFERPVVFILCITFFILGTRKTFSTFWSSLGLFWIDRYKALAEAVANIVFSVFLVQRWGVFGVFAGTVLSMFPLALWLEPWLFHRFYLQKAVGPFLLRQTGDMAVTGLIWLVVDRLCTLVNGPLLWVLVARALICMGLGNLLLLLAHFRRKEFKTVVRRGTALIQKYFRGRKSAA